MTNMYTQEDIERAIAMCNDNLVISLGCVKLKRYKEAIDLLRETEDNICLIMIAIMKLQCNIIKDEIKTRKTEEEL